MATRAPAAHGTRGKYDRDDERVRPNKIHVAPHLMCQPTATELTYLLPWILDGTLVCAVCLKSPPRLMAAQAKV